MKHLDLFSGIGGFALAVDTVWPRSEHIFCDNDPFCQQVLKKHWPNSKIYGDIRDITNASLDRRNSQTQQAVDEKTQGREKRRGFDDGSVYLLTGGFPCQPFSQAGRRKGTQDDRYLWPEMFRVIQLAKPQWVIAENVRGLVTWNDGLVLEQVCTDLESEGYQVQPFIIPAVAVNAPHRRDRVWIVANRRREYGSKGNEQGMETNQKIGTTRSINIKRQDKNASDTERKRHEGNGERRNDSEGQHRLSRGKRSDQRPDWTLNWLEVATRLCGVDDGLPARLDGFELTKSGHRRERLKSLGNAIVPQVAIEIMRAIRDY